MKKTCIETARKIKMDLENKISIQHETKVLSYKLYKYLSNKPSFYIYDHQKNIYVLVNENQINIDFFSKKNRIEKLIDWTLDVLPIINLLKTECRLPIIRDSEIDLDCYLDQQYNKFLQALKNLPCENPNDIKVKAIEEFCETIVEALKFYLDGYPGTAFEKFKNGMDIFLKHHNDLDRLTLLDDEIRTKDILFRIRSEKDEDKTINQIGMFHIPFDLREIVGSYRFSISGYPSLYLGSSLLGCWEELNKPQKDSLNMSAFKIKNIENVKILDISFAPKLLATTINDHFNLSSNKHDFTDLLFVWVLSSACSVKVKHVDRPFKSEYIIPQLLTEWVRRSSDFDAISYTSTKALEINNSNYTLYKNYVFPSKIRSNKGHCSYLESLFEISDPVKYSVLEYPKYRSGNNAISKFAFDEKIEEFGDDYYSTDFGKLESLCKDIVLDLKGR
ncbi:hypothetical protein [Bacillus pumilus]|uniref:hypothetical protein n=1 Tax=Bacillus pumilus TaxID=1408 RepID=UPI00227E3654|nr:hypothetical protein [Bacillus pumilus]MCY7500133.1 hypothetical protein [Bacillus pumilus]MCY7528543.1 hypothetical protein [Bacillus pumilus]MED4439498.1 hypothetical protein [Bacillus pumilus]MED4489941.1 hypothetical protein [Bacillus pumilus]